MGQVRIPAVFMRGGTSKAIVFKAGDLPEDRGSWDAIFLAAMGSPDPNARQLDGMGGGISSLSKVCVVGPPSRADADVDYTFAQVGVPAATVGYGGNCGNMSSAMGPFAVDEGLVAATGPEAEVRIHNTNTGKIIHARFALDGGRAAVEGDFAVPGVSGTGSPVRLEFREPGGAVTGRLLPTGNVIDAIEVPGMGTVEASLVDAANPCVFVEAEAMGLTGTELPAEIDAMGDVMARLEAIRARGAVMMGMAASPEEATETSPAYPFVGMVAPPRDATLLSGATLKAGDGDLTVRNLSSGNAHRALQITGGMCLAIAARITGTVVHRHARAGADAGADPGSEPGAGPGSEPGAGIRLMHPSGILPVACEVTKTAEGWHAAYGAVYRTQRRLFEGRVLVPGSKVGVT